MISGECQQPLVLAFDTSAAHCAVALLLGDVVLVQRLEQMHKGQAERLFALLEEVLSEADKAWDDLDGIGCGVGPGNFTGIRLSVSAARGLALSLGKPAIGVSALEALLHGTRGSVLVSIDARRDQLYVQTSAGEAPQVIAVTELTDIPAKFDVCIGHRASEIAQILGAQPAPPKYPLAVAIARIASARLEQPNPRPAPLYLKAADAAPSRETPPVMLS